MKGKTNCSFKWWRQEQRENEDLPEDDPNRVYYETVEEKAKHDKKFLEFKGSVFDIPDSTLTPGSYVVSF